jgi:uncharacterized OB-fold protein
MIGDYPYFESRSLLYKYRIPIKGTEAFWSGLAKGLVSATRCLQCKKIFFPPQSDCYVCLESNVEWIALSENVKLETFTRVGAVPQGFSSYPDYTIAIASTKEDQRVMGWLFVENPKIGMDLRMTTRKVSGDIFTIVFVLA